MPFELLYHHIMHLAQRLLLHITECVGGVAAGLMAGPLYGTGATWLKKMLPWIKPTEEPTGENNELEDQGHSSKQVDSRSDSREVEMQAPLYNSKPPARGKKQLESSSQV